MAKLVIEIDGKQAKAQAQELEAVLRRLGVQAKTTGDDIDGVSDSARQSAQESGEFGSALEAVKGRLVSVAAVLATATAAYSAFKEIVAASAREAIEAEDAERRLAIAVQNRGAAAGLSAAQLSAMASELQRVTRFGDEAIKSAQEVLVRFNSIDGSNIERVTRLTLDFAEATGQDAASAARLLGRSLDEPGEGMRALAQAGIVLEKSQRDLLRALDEAGREAEGQALLLDMLEDRLSGVSTKGESTSRSIDQLKNAIGELGETLGGAFLEGLRGTVDGLRDMAESEDAAATAREIGEAVGELASAVASLVQLGNDSGLLTIVRVLAEANKYVPGLMALRGLSNQLGNDPLGNGGSRSTTREELDQQRASAVAAHEVQTSRERMALFQAETRQYVTGFQERLRNIVQHYDEWNKADEDAAKKRAENAKILSPQFLAPLDVARQNPLEKSIEKMIPDAERLGALLEELGVSTRDWATQQAFVEKMYAAGLLTVSQYEQAIAAIGNATVTWGRQVEDSFQKIKDSAQEAAVQGVQDAFADAFQQLVTEGEISWESIADSLLQTFARIASELLAEWLTLELAKTKITLQQAAIRNAAESGGKGSASQGQSGVNPSGMASAGKFMTSGSTASGFAWAAIAVAAVLALRNWGDKKRDAKQYDDLNAFDFEDGRLRAARGTRGIRANDQIVGSITGFWQAFQESTGTFLTGLDNLAIRVRHDQKKFKVELAGVVIGEFKSANEAIIAGIKAQFASAEFSSGVSQAVREAVENFKGTDPSQLTEAVQYVQSIVDAASGLSEMELGASKIASDIAEVAANLRALGVSAAETAKLTGGYAIQSFRNAWDSIRGASESPEEEKKRRESAKAILLAQMKLEAIRIEGQIKALQAEEKVVRVGLGLAATEVKGRHRILEAQGNLVRAEFGMMTSYVQGRQHLLEAEATIRNAELEALGVYLNELTKLIAEIEATPIKVSGLGGGGAANDNLNIARRGLGLAERRTSALEEIRRLQRELVLGDLSPYNDAQKVDAAKAEYERIAAKAAAGNVAAMERLPEVARTYLDLYRSAYGTTGDYGNVFDQVNALLSQILRDRGITPVEVSQQADANATALTRALKRDSRGKLHTRAEELEAELVENRRELRRIYDAIERQNNSANNNQPNQTLVVIPNEGTPRGPQRFRRSA